MSVEDYLSSIDISKLDNPAAPINSIEDVISLIGARDEQEAIGVMYQALSLVEVYFNRMIQHGLLAVYNANKSNADKPVNDYFETETYVINEIIQNFQKSSLKSKKPETTSSESDSKYKELQEEYDSLKARFGKLLKKCEMLKKKVKESEEADIETEGITKSVNGAIVNPSEIEKLKSNIEDLNEKLKKEKEAHNQSLRALVEKETELKRLSERRHNPGSKAYLNDIS